MHRSKGIWDTLWLSWKLRKYHQLSTRNIGNYKNISNYCDVRFSFVPMSLVITEPFMLRVFIVGEHLRPNSHYTFLNFLEVQSLRLKFLERSNFEESIKMSVSLWREKRTIWWKNIDMAISKKMIAKLIHQSLCKIFKETEVVSRKSYYS